MNTQIVLADLIAQFVPTVPLHHATRVWASQRHETPGGVDVMRAYVVRHELGDYPLQWDERGRSFVPIPKVCPHCERLFIARNGNQYCSRGCAVRFRQAAKRYARGVANATASKPRAGEFNTIITAIDRLRRLEVELKEVCELLEDHLGLINGIAQQSTWDETVADVH